MAPARRFFPRSIAAVVLAGATALALGAEACASRVVAPSETAGPSSPVIPAAHPRGPLRAGVAKVDITPSPGFSLLGHGPEGRVSTGTLLRLHCQAFVFSEEIGSSVAHREEVVAFVPCDLSWPSLLLQRTVAAKLVKDRIPIGPAELVLSATHTHASPAHYLGAGNYSGLLSTESPGFSDEMLEFLATKIAGAIEEAYNDRTEACVAWSKATFRDPSAPTEDARPDQGPWLAGLTFAKNRSLAAFERDSLTPEEAERYTDPRALSDDPRERRAARPALFAVEGAMSVLRVDKCPANRPPAPMGAFAVVGVHPTAIANTNELYHGDLFGYATREAEVEIAAESGAPDGLVVGIANGVEGDVSPVVDAQGTREARRLGGDIAREIVALWESAGQHLAGDAPLRRAYRELDLPGARVETRNRFYDDLRAAYAFPGTFRTTASTCPSAPKGRGLHIPGDCDPVLCDAANLGTAAAGGAPDGRTFFFGLPETSEGAIAPLSTTCHAPKLELDAPVDEFYAFPKVAPIHAVEIAGELVTTFPGEVATLPAYRARRQLETYLASAAGPAGDEAARASRAEVVQIGLTGEYLQYMTTSEEYGAQQYEGASTLYGPNEARFIANQQLCLARWLYDPDIDVAADRECSLDWGVGERRPQPAIGQVTEVVFEPSQKRKGHPDASCRSERHGAFHAANEPDLAARPLRVAACKNNVAEDVDETACGAHVYRLERDGERGYAVRWKPPGDCADRRFAPRVRIVDSATGRMLACDEGDGIEIRWVEGDWRIGWYPNAREWRNAEGKAFAFEITPGPGLDSEVSDAVGTSCWDWR